HAFPLVAFGSSYTSVIAGKNMTCGVAGSLGYCWGLGADGRLGTGFMRDATVGQPIAGTSGPRSADIQYYYRVGGAGLTYACGLTQQGAIFCWGTGAHGELGQR